MNHVKALDPVNNRADTRLPVIFAVLYCAFMIASLVVIPVLAPGARIPNPFGPDDPSRHFFLNASYAIRVSDFLQVLSGCCLAGLSAALSAVQRSSRVPIVASALTLAGGLGGAVLLVLTALFSWALACPGAVDPEAAFRTLQFVPFLLGGPGWAGFFALFLAGVAMAGSGALPRWVIGSGYFLAIVSALATLVLLTLGAAVCLPIARFLSFLWLILVAILMARRPAKAL